MDKFDWCMVGVLIGSFFVLILLDVTMVTPLKKEIQTLEPLAEIGAEKLCQGQQYFQEIDSSGTRCYDITYDDLNKTTLEEGDELCIKWYINITEPSTIIYGDYKNFTTGRLMDDGRVECVSFIGFEKISETEDDTIVITIHEECSGESKSYDYLGDCNIERVYWERGSRITEKIHMKPEYCYSQIFTIEELIK